MGKDQSAAGRSRLKVKVGSGGPWDGDPRLEHNELRPL